MVKRKKVKETLLHSSLASCASIATVWSERGSGCKSYKRKDKTIWTENDLPTAPIEEREWGRGGWLREHSPLQPSRFQKKDHLWLSGPCCAEPYLHISWVIIRSIYTSIYI